MMIRTQIMLTPSLSESLREIATRSDRSLSMVVRELLAKCLEREESDFGADSLLKMARNSSKKGQRDLSVNDEYLYGRQNKIDLC